jgi:hypothetical protein
MSQIFDGNVSYYTEQECCEQLPDCENHDWSLYRYRGQILQLSAPFHVGHVYLTWGRGLDDETGNWLHDITHRISEKTGKMVWKG